MSKVRTQREARNASAQGMIDSAPSKGSKGTYLKLPAGLKFFMPEINKTYRLIFMTWKAGNFNPAVAKGSWASNRFIPVHRNIGPNNDSFICSAKAFKKPCPICADFQRLRAEGKDWDTIKELRPKDRELFLVHDVDGDKNNLQIWDESVHLFGEFLRAKIDRKASYKLFADPDQGKLVEVVGKKKVIGKGSCAEFGGIEFEDREPVSDELLAKADKYCLDTCPIEIPFDKLKEIYAQTGAATEEEEETEETTAEEETEESEPEEEVAEEDDETAEGETEQPEEEALEETEETEEETETEEPEPEEEVEVEEEDSEPEPEPEEEEASTPPPAKKKIAPVTTKPVATKPVATKPTAAPTGKKPVTTTRPAATKPAPTGKKK